MRRQRFFGQSLRVARRHRRRLGVISGLLLIWGPSFSGDGVHRDREFGR
jgi:hypothetical protein